MARTVGDLIRELQKLNPDLPVTAECCQSHGAAHEIENIRPDVRRDPDQGRDVVVLPVNQDYISLD